MLDGVLVDPLAHDALLFRVDDHTSAPVRRGCLEHVAVFVYGDPVERLIEPSDVTIFRANSGRRVRGRMTEDRVDIDAAVAAAQGIANLDIAQRAAAGRSARHHKCTAADPLDRDLRARATVGRRIDGDGIGYFGRPLGVVFPGSAAGGHDLDAMIDKGRHRPTILSDLCLDDPIIQRPRTAVIDNRHGGSSSRRTLGPAHQRRRHY